MSQPFNVNETIKKAEQEYGLGKGEYFKVQEGDNVIRLLSPCLPHQSEFTDKQGVTKTSFKFVAWIIDRRDNVVRPYFMPMTIMNAIGDLQTSQYYGFEVVPMPYDIIIKAKNAGKLEVEYSVLPVPERIPLTGAEEAMLKERPTIEEYVEKLKEKQGEPVVQEQGQSDEDKAKAVASGLPGAKNATGQTEANSGPSTQDVNIDDIPFD